MIDIAESHPLFLSNNFDSSEYTPSLSLKTGPKKDKRGKEKQVTSSTLYRFNTLYPAGDTVVPTSLPVFNTREETNEQKNLI